jgi:hypothetical protein
MERPVMTAPSLPSQVAREQASAAKTPANIRTAAIAAETIFIINPPRKNRLTVRFGSRVDVPLQDMTRLSDAVLGTSSAVAVAPAKPHMTPSPSESQRQFQSQFTAFQNLATDANEWLGSDLWAARASSMDAYV